MVTLDPRYLPLTIVGFENISRVVYTENIQFIVWAEIFDANSENESRALFRFPRRSVDEACDIKSLYHSRIVF